MTRWMFAGCTALAALAAVAVLDAGSRAAVAAPSVSPFAGTYAWSTSLAPSFPVTISDGGKITSPLSNPDINGSVSADGTYSFTYTESGLIDGDGPKPGGGKRYRSSDRMAGHMALDPDGNIVGTIDPDYANPSGGSFFWLRQ